MLIILNKNLKKNEVLNWLDSEPYPFLVISRYVSTALAVIMFFAVLFGAFLIVATASFVPFLSALFGFLLFLAIPELIQILFDIRVDQRYMRNELHKLKNKE